MAKQVDTYEAAKVNSMLLQIPGVIHQETGDNAVASLVFQVCVQALGRLNEDLLSARDAEEMSTMFDGLITTEEPAPVAEKAEATND